MLTQGPRPKRLRENLGLDVKLKTEALAPDEWATTSLKTLGQALKQGENSYLGSIAIHYYRTPDRRLGGEYEVQTVQQVSIGDLNEYIALMGVQNLTIELRKHYGHSTKTLDKNDQRGEQ